LQQLVVLLDQLIAAEFDGATVGLMACRASTDMVFTPLRSLEN